MESEHRKPYESLSWAKRVPDTIKFYEQRGDYAEADHFREMLKKHKRWLKTDQGRSDLGEARMYERPAMAHLQGEYLENCIENLYEECDVLCVEIRESIEDGELDFYGISEICADQWLQMLSKIQVEVDGMLQQAQDEWQIFERYFEQAGFEQGYNVNEKHFNIVMASLWEGHYELVGFNPYREDYQCYPTGTSISHIRNDARERVMRLTKEKMIALYSYSINLTLAFTNLRMQFDAVKMAMHLAKGDKAQLLHDVENINTLYESLNARTNSYNNKYIICDEVAERKFDSACYYLLDECWLV